MAEQAPRSRRERPSRHVAGLGVVVLVSSCLGWLPHAEAAPLAGAAAQAGSAPRAGSAGSPGANGVISCQAAHTTLAMQECLGRQLLQADQELERYLERAQRRLSAEQDRPAGALSRAAAELAASQQSWQRSRDRYCQALWSFWSGGTIRGPMLLSCRIALARERQRRIWLDFLSFPDGSPPLLPEPPPGASASRP